MGEDRFFPIPSMKTILLFAVLSGVGILAFGQQDDDLTHPQGTNLGIHTFSGKCAPCHDTGKGGAPDRYSLNRNTPEEVYASMTSGTMAEFAKGLSELEIRVVAVYVGGRPFGSAREGDASLMPNQCSAHPPLSDDLKTSSWNGWGFDLSNSRYQPSPGLSGGGCPPPETEMGLRFSECKFHVRATGGGGGRVFIGSDAGFLYSLDAATGCVHWSFKANAGIRTAVSIGPGGRSASKFLAYIGDIKGNVYALNADTGMLVWTSRADNHPVARITGSPKLDQGKLYVPVSSLEESGGGNPQYPCCTFRGSAWSLMTPTPGNEFGRPIPSRRNRSR